MPNWPWSCRRQRPRPFIRSGIARHISGRPLVDARPIGSATRRAARTTLLRCQLLSPPRICSAKIGFPRLRKKANSMELKSRPARGSENGRRRARIRAMCSGGLPVLGMGFLSCFKCALPPFSGSPANRNTGYNSSAPSGGHFLLLRLANCAFKGPSIRCRPLLFMTRAIAQTPAATTPTDPWSTLCQSWSLPYAAPYEHSGNASSSTACALHEVASQKSLSPADPSTGACLWRTRRQRRSAKLPWANSRKKSRSR